MIADSKNSLIQGNMTGQCGDCGGLIPVARLQALPGCARCIDCQSTFEGGQ